MTRLFRRNCHSEEPARRLVTWESVIPGGYGLPRAADTALAMTDGGLRIATPLRFAHRRPSRFPLPLVATSGGHPRFRLASSAIPQGHLLRHLLVPRGASLAPAALRRNPRNDIPSRRHGAKKPGRGFPRPGSVLVKKASQSSRRARREEMKSYFAAACTWQNTPIRLRSVRIVRHWRTMSARSRLQAFLSKNGSAVF